MANVLSGEKKTIVNKASNMDVHFSSKNMEWETPLWLYNKLNDEFGFIIDAACNNKNCRAEYGFVKDRNNDSLKKDWYASMQDILSATTRKTQGAIFLNPPYGRGIGKWVQKAFEEAQKGCTVVCLLPARTDTTWFHDYCANGEVRFIKNRLRFGGSDIKGPAPFPSCVVIFEPDIIPVCYFWDAKND